MQSKLLTIAIECVSNVINLTTPQTVCSMPTIKEINLMLLGVLQSLLVVKSVQESQESQVNTGLELLRTLYHTQLVQTQMTIQVSQSTQTPITQDATAPITQDATAPITQDATEPITQDATEPITQDATAPIIKATREIQRYEPRRDTRYESRHSSHYEPCYESRDEPHRESYSTKQRDDRQRNYRDDRQRNYRDDRKKITRRDSLQNDNTQMHDLYKQLQNEKNESKLRSESSNSIARPFTYYEKSDYLVNNGVHEFCIMKNFQLCTYTEAGIDATILENMYVYYYSKNGGVATPFVLRRGGIEYLVASDKKLYNVVNKVVVEGVYKGIRQTWIHMM